jgi:threonine dehydrogenase-like Zn-dependent dehydrogenase
MKGVFFNGKLCFPADLPMPDPGPGEALVKVTLAGICNTDLEIVKGYMGYRGVLGHEFVGVVEEAPQGAPGIKGSRVVGEINLACGKCAYCMGGVPTHCFSRRVLGIYEKDGSMAEYVTLPIRNLYRVPDELPDEEAVFTEPLAAAFQIIEQVEFGEGDRVLVMGDGKLGLLCAQALALTTADITLLGKHEANLNIAWARGIRTALKGDFRPDEPFDFVVEATGRAEGLQEALRYVRPRGAVILKSTLAQGAKLNLAPIVINEITIIGSRCGPFQTTLRSLAGRSVDVRSMIAGVYPFSDADKAFKRAQKPGALKVLLDMSS